MINIQEERKTIYNKPHQKGSNSVTNLNFPLAKVGLYLENSIV